jgi:hypothetical protein
MDWKETLSSIVSNFQLVSKNKLLNVCHKFRKFKINLFKTVSTKSCRGSEWNTQTSHCMSWFHLGFMELVRQILLWLPQVKLDWTKNTAKLLAYMDKGSILRTTRSTVLITRTNKAICTVCFSALWSLEKASPPHKEINLRSLLIVKMDSNSIQ